MKRCYLQAVIDVPDNFNDDDLEDLLVSDVRYRVQFARVVPYEGQIEPGMQESWGPPGCEAPLHDITTDGKTVWVNSAGGLVGRFGLNGIDIHRPATEQGNGECLFCTHTPVKKHDWRIFQQKMLELFSIEVSDRYKPMRFK